MKNRIGYLIPCGVAVASLLVLMPLAAATLDARLMQHATRSSACSAESRREALKTVQTEALRSVPSKVPSLVGAAYFGTYTAGSKPPLRRCVTPEE